MPDNFDIRGKKIWVAGHTGLVGSALVKKLQNEDCRILTVEHSVLDLTKQEPTEKWIEENKPDAVLIAAAKVGGLGANANFPADFLYENMAIAQNIIHASYLHKIKKLVFLGSSCIYPKSAEQPIKEEALLTGELEPTNEAYAIAKIAGIKLCQFYRRQYGCDFISLMPCNIYGPGDRWNDENAHVIPSLISRIHKAKIKNLKEVTIWGSGWPLREFIYADDLAGGILQALKTYSGECPLNTGSGQEISIGQLAELIKKQAGFEGQLIFDPSKPDGVQRKLLDSSRINALGWKAKTSLEKGLQLAYEDFLVSSNHI